MLSSCTTCFIFICVIYSAQASPCFEFYRFHSDLSPAERSEPGFEYSIGIDYESDDCSKTVITQVALHNYDDPKYHHTGVFIILVEILSDLDEQFISFQKTIQYSQICELLESVGMVVVLIIATSVLTYVMYLPIEICYIVLGQLCGIARLIVLFCLYSYGYYYLAVSVWML